MVRKMKGQALVQYNAKPGNADGVTKRKKQRKKKQRTRVPRRVTFSCSEADKDKLCMAICGQVDPFCNAACGARRYDQNTTPSFPVQFRAIHLASQFATGTGKAAVRINPNIYNTTYAATAESAGVITTWGSAASADGYTSDLAQYRVVSCGVHVYNITSSDNAQGVLGAVTTPGAIATLDPNSTLYQGNERMQNYLGEYCWVSTRLGPDAQNYVADDTTGNLGWTELAAYVTAAGSSDARPQFYAEIFINCEVHATVGTTYARFVQPAAPDVDLIENAVANIAPTQPAVRPGSPKQASSETKSTVWDYVERLAQVAGPYLIEAAIAAL